MKTRKWRPVCGIFAVLVFLLTVGAGGGAAATTPASGPTTVPTYSAEARAHSLLSEGINQALGGEFSAALETVAEAKALAAADPKIAYVYNLLDEYNARLAEAEAERAKEYAEAVERVHWGRIVEEYFASRPEEVATDLRDKVHKVVEAVGRSSNGDALDDAAKRTYEDLQESTLQALDESLEALDQAVAMLQGDDSEYAGLFRRVAASLRKRMEKYRQVWAQADVSKPSTRRGTARELRGLESALYDDLADLDGLVTDKPWREALMRAIVAERVASPADRVREQPWYQKLLRDSEARAERFVEQAQWRDALMAYVSLSELEEDNEAYEDKVKAVRRHVRVLRLYGQEEAEEPLPTTQPVEPEPTWQELVEGADAAMAEKAISQLDSYYVTAVDYAELARGALSAVKILAETPQVVQTFPGLADPAKRKAFVGDIENQLKAIEIRDRPDHLDLTLALNSVLRSSERTVHIPVSVLVVEFTDGWLDELDEFSSMIWPHDVADFDKYTMGHFYGVGIQISKEPGEPLRVVTPLADSPALEAGLKPGDLILAVDGRATEDIALDKLIRMITGEKGTKVTLRVKRAGRLEPFDVTLTRREINLATVRGWQSQPDGHWDYFVDPDEKIAYIRILQFTDQTVDAMEDVLDRLSKEGVRSLVLDLRFNPGGLLRSATDVADEFLQRGRLVSTEGRQARRQSVNATPSGEYVSGDLVVLVNQVSASAAEIVSGAIKDWDRGLLVGQRTYGKGSVQNVIPIRRDRAVLKLTTAYYYLPSGRLLHRRNGQKDWGVDPDIDIFMTPKQTRRWLELRQKTDLLQEVDPEQLRRDLDRQYEADLQLATAVLLLKLQRLQEPSTPFDSPVTAAVETTSP